MNQIEQDFNGFVELRIEASQKVLFSQLHFIIRGQTDLTDLGAVGGQPTGDGDPNAAGVVVQGDPVLDGAFTIGDRADQGCPAKVLNGARGDL